MSLTSELADRNSPVTRFLDERFPRERIKPLSKSWYELVKPAAVLRPDMENPPWGTIGTAFDYRLRYFWAETPLDDLVAASGMRILYTQRLHTTGARCCTRRLPRPQLPQPVSRRQARRASAPPICGRTRPNPRTACAGRTQP